MQTRRKHRQLRALAKRHGLAIQADYWGSAQPAHVCDGQDQERFRPDDSPPLGRGFDLAAIRPRRGAVDGNRRFECSHSMDAAIAIVLDGHFGVGLRLVGEPHQLPRFAQLRNAHTIVRVHVLLGPMFDVRPDEERQRHRLRPGKARLHTRHSLRPARCSLGNEPFDHAEGNQHQHGKHADDQRFKQGRIAQWFEHEELRWKRELRSSRSRVKNRGTRDEGQVN